MEWIRGQLVGRGSFATVSLAIAADTATDCPRIMAVKSAAFPNSSSLRKEKDILLRLRDCPQILTCFGDDVTVENGNRVYNLFLEYVSGGTLADLVRASPAGLPHSHVRRFAASILRGLSFIHARGYVHCDVKLQNLLLHPADHDVRIADFGLAAEAGAGTAELRGTPLYMSPELVARGDCGAPADVWSFGCAVLEMVTGKPAWSCAPDADVAALLFRVGFTDEVPEIPTELSEEARDFLIKCFSKDPATRWTAEMLLEHPFLSGSDGASTDDQEEDFVSLLPPKKLFESPRSAFDFPRWNSLTASACSSPSDSLTSILFHPKSEQSASELNSRIQQLAIGRETPDWFSSSSDDWVTVREPESDIHPLTNISNEMDHTNDAEDPVLILEKMMSEEEGQREGGISTVAEQPEAATGTTSTASIGGGDAAFESLSSSSDSMPDPKTRDLGLRRSSMFCPLQPLFRNPRLAGDHKRRSYNTSSEQFDCHSSSELFFLGRNDNCFCINSFSEKYKIDLDVFGYSAASSIQSFLFLFSRLCFFSAISFRQIAYKLIPISAAHPKRSPFRLLCN